MRETSIGLYLGDENGNDVLLPTKYCPDRFEIGHILEVFIYLDYAERIIATNIRPKILLHEFALLRVTDVNEFGAFVDWGLEKELLVPFSEQKQKMEVGRSYIVFLDIDWKSERLFASNKLDKHLQNEFLEIEEGEEVDLIIRQKTNLGYSVIINHSHRGLLYANEIFSTLNIGDRRRGYVKRIRADHKIDVSLNPLGFQQSNDAAVETIISALRKHDGLLQLSDRSSPKEISDLLGMSKKAFKRAIGTLYKARRISIEKNEIKLID